MAKSLKQLIQECVKVTLPEIEIGVVTESEPLRVTLADDAKINLSVKSLIIPTAKQPLKKGEQLYLLALNNSKIYYVLDRV